MIYKLFEALLWGFSVGILAVVYRHILGKEEAFNFWWRFGAKYEGRAFFKVIWGCAHCFAGQLTWWTFGMYAATRPAVFPSLWASITFIFGAWFLTVLATAAAIFTAKILSWIMERKGI